MFMDQPECAIIFSWHIADELAPKLRAKGYKGMLVTPCQSRARCREVEAEEARSQAGLHSRARRPNSALRKVRLPAFDLSRRTAAFDLPMP